MNSINDIRAMFFSFLKPYLECVGTYIDKNRKADDVNTIFGKYFNTPGYLSEFDEASAPFAKRLVNSSQFQHFCDDYFSEELTNY